MLPIALLLLMWPFHTDPIIKDVRCFKSPVFYQCTVYFSKVLPNKDTITVLRSDNAAVTWMVAPGPPGEEKVFTFAEAQPLIVKSVQFHGKTFDRIKHIDSMETQSRNFRATPTKVRSTPKWRKNK